MYNKSLRLKWIPGAKYGIMFLSERDLGILSVLGLLKFLYVFNIMM